MQLRSPNLTPKCSTMSSGKTLSLGSRSRFTKIFPAWVFAFLWVLATPCWMWICYFPGQIFCKTSQGSQVICKWLHVLYVNWVPYVHVLCSYSLNVDCLSPLSAELRRLRLQYDVSSQAADLRLRRCCRLAFDVD